MRRGHYLLLLGLLVVVGAWWFSGRESRRVRATLEEGAALLDATASARRAAFPELCEARLELSFPSERRTLEQGEALELLEGWLQAGPHPVVLFEGLELELSGSDATARGLLRISSSEATDLHATEWPFVAQLHRSGRWRLRGLELAAARTYLPEARP